MSLRLALKRSRGSGADDYAEDNPTGHAQDPINIGSSCSGDNATHPVSRARSGSPGEAKVAAADVRKIVGADQEDTVDTEDTVDQEGKGGEDEDEDEDEGGQSSDAAGKSDI